MTYNVLAERMATPSQHPYTPSRVLSWSYRKELLLQEILQANADIVCLQVRPLFPLLSPFPLLIHVVLCCPLGVVVDGDLLLML